MTGETCPYFGIIISPTLKNVKRFQIEKIDVFFMNSRNLEPENITKLNRKKTVNPKKNVGLWLEFALFGS